MKLVFAGTPEFAVPSLKALHAAGHEIVVLTQPDKPQGRKGILTPSPVKAAALGMGLPVLQPARVKEDFSALKEVGAPLMVTCAYGQILSQEVLDLFPLGVWNVHASLLPAYRGAAPIARAVMNGETATGVTVMKTDIGLDTGDTFLRGAVEIAQDETAGTLTEKLSALGATLIEEAVRRIAEGDVCLERQPDGFVCKKVQRTQIDFSASANEVGCLVRGLSPAPLAYGVIEGNIINVFNASVVEDDSSVPFGTVISASPKRGLIVKCGKGAVRLNEVQPAGGKKMSDKDFCNGRKVTEGTRFDQPVL